MSARIPTKSAGRAAPGPTLSARVPATTAVDAVHASTGSFPRGASRCSPDSFTIFERMTREIANEDGTAVDRDHRMMLGVLCVEMGWLMVVEVHRDHDAVEGADPGHDAMMSAGQGLG